MAPIVAMTPTEFVRSPQWGHTSDEVRLEILAVCLPILIYAVALGAAQCGLFPKGQAPDLEHFLVVPDALFGGCILHAFAAIQGYRYMEIDTDTLHAALDGIHRWRIFGLGGLIVCSLLSGLAVIFQPHWATAVGLLSIYFGGLAYKKVVFLRSFLTSMHGGALE